MDGDGYNPYVSTNILKGQIWQIILGGGIWSNQNNHPSHTPHNLVGALIKIYVCIRILIDSPHFKVENHADAEYETPLK